MGTGHQAPSHHIAVPHRTDSPAYPALQGPKHPAPLGSEDFVASGQQEAPGRNAEELGICKALGAPAPFPNSEASLALNERSSGFTGFSPEGGAHSQDLLPLSAHHLVSLSAVSPEHP